MYKTYAYGHDYGHSNTCGIAIINGETRMHLMPSALLKGTYEKFAQSMSADSYSNTQAVLRDRKHIVSFLDESFYVGDLAFQHSPSQQRDALISRSGDRYWSSTSIAMLLATSGTIISDKEYGLAVVTNLPVIAHNEENARNIKNTLSGDYEFILDGIPRTAHISVRKTVKEGAGANIAYGKSRKDKTAYIDIGGRTTDLYVIEDHIPIPESCTSLVLGVETAFNEVIKGFNAKFDVPLKLLDAYRLQMEYAGSHQYSSIPTIGGAELDVQKVEQYVDKIVRGVGGDIREGIRSFWNSGVESSKVLSDVSLVLLVGGGAHYFEKDIRPLFNNRLRRTDTPEYANALGYAQLAQHFLQREAMKVAGV
jgi:hypothetical protein